MSKIDLKKLTNIDELDDEPIFIKFKRNKKKEEPNLKKKSLHDHRKDYVEFSEED